MGRLRPPQLGPRARSLLLIGATLATALVLIWLSRTPGLAVAVSVAGISLGVLSIWSGAQQRQDDVTRLARRIEDIGTMGVVSDDRRSEAGALQGPPDTPTTLSQRILERASAIDERLTTLMKDRARLRAFIDAIEVPVFATDERGRLEMCNRAGERLFFRRAGRLVGLELDELFPSSALLSLHERARRGVAGREDVALTLGGAPRTYEVCAVPLRLDIADLPAQAAPRAGVVMTMRDVTEVAETVRLKTDFVANASHELRTPIASIRAAVETLFEGGDDPAMRKRLTEMIQAHTLRLEEMVADLLDLSHIENSDQQPERRPIPFREAAATISGLFESVCAERSIELVFDIDPALERLETDGKLLHLILRNLVDNALKYAFENTRVLVSAEATPSFSMETALSSGEPSEIDRPAGGMRLKVSDQGMGIPLKHQHRIFERFYQVDPARTGGGRRGTGLGLAIVKHATLRLGGEVSVESVWQQGTTITVDLPHCVLMESRSEASAPEHKKS